MGHAKDSFSGMENIEKLKEDYQKITSVLAGHQIAFWEYDIPTGECNFTDEYFSILGDKKELVTQEDLPYIISDVLKHDGMSNKVKLKSYFVTLAHGLKPMATLSIEIDGQVYEESSSGDGQYDAFVRALRKVYKVTLGRKFPMLINYAVSIPPGGRTDAFVQTVITWSFGEKVFRTRGLDADQTEAAIKATIKMLNIIEEY